MQFNFEWDPKKARKNLNKHKISFESASYIFLDPKALTIIDFKHKDKEERWITIGMDKTNQLIVLCHTYQESDEVAIIRIISARKATKREGEQYLSGGY